MQFKVLVFTFKAFNGIDLGYLINGLVSLEQAHPTHADREGLLWILSVKERQLSGSRRRASLLHHLLFGTSYPLALCFPPIRLFGYHIDVFILSIILLLFCLHVFHFSLFLLL